MAEFKVIETQEEFDNAIRKRLEQKEREVSERFKGYMSTDEVTALRNGYEEQLSALQTTLNAANEKINGYDAQITEAQTRASKAENELLRGQIAVAKGLPFELRDRLIGNSKEELEKDADALVSFVQPRNAPPMRSNDPATYPGNTSAEIAKQAFADWFGQLTTE